MRCHIELIGRLSADPMFRDLPNGDRHAILSIETTEGWRDRATGERRNRSTWHDVRVSKAGLVKAIDRTLKTGDLIYLSGSLRYSEWTDSSQVRRKTAEIAVKASEHQLIFLCVAGQDPPG
jgi:single-strand DNA-binding protein